MSNKPRPSVIPVPPTAHNFNLFNRLINTTHKRGGLNVSDRLVLVAVLQYIPDTAAGNTTSIDCIIALSPANMAFLASRLRSAFLTARGWKTSPIQQAPSRSAGIS